MARKNEIHLRSMRPGDVPFAVSLTDSEGWGNTARDFLRYVDVYTDGSFVAELDGKNIGMITSVTFGKLGLLGNLIVKEEYRGQGAGRKLLERGIRHLRDSGCRTIELDGDFPAVIFYRTLGFKDKFLSLRFFKPPEEAKRDTSRAASGDIKKLLEVDKALIPVDRTRLLKSIIEDHREYIAVDNPREISGYGIIKPKNLGFRQIGPVVAGSVSGARKIIASLTEKYADKEIRVGIGEHNRDAIKIYLDLGYFYNPASLIMYLGERIDYEENIYAIISGDLG